MPQNLIIESRPVVFKTHDGSIVSRAKTDGNGAVIWQVLQLIVEQVRNHAMNQ
jgi:hypothetical protein